MVWIRSHVAYIIETMCAIVTKSQHQITSDESMNAQYQIRLTDGEPTTYFCFRPCDRINEALAYHFHLGAPRHNRFIVYGTIHRPLPRVTNLTSKPRRLLESLWDGTGPVSLTKTDILYSSTGRLVKERQLCALN
jgi:hypothetical protein